MLRNVQVVSRIFFFFLEVGSDIYLSYNCVVGRAPPWPVRTEGGEVGGERMEEGEDRSPQSVSTANTPCWRPSDPWVTGADSQTRSYQALNCHHVIARVQSSNLRLNTIKHSTETASLFINKSEKFYLCWAAAAAVIIINIDGIIKVSNASLCSTWWPSLHREISASKSQRRELLIQEV